MSAPNTPHPALSHRCPFCYADPGQPCRKHRGRSNIEADVLHSRRIALASPIPIEERQAPRVNALCCVCGNLRTVNSDYSRWQDPNHAGSPRGKAEGWLKTESLKCDACGERTRHAILRATDDKYRDWDEGEQLIALGDADDRKYPSSDEYIARLRREYRELYPRNPFLRHRYWTNEAEEAWTAGHKKVTALCGEQITLKCDPSQPSSKKEEPGRIVADQLSDTEYEDPETGLWWIDMACVDCCRVSNNHHRAARRKQMVDWLCWLYARPERVPDDHVEALIEAFKATQPDRKVADR